MTIYDNALSLSAEKIDKRNLLELPKVELWVINGTLKTCNTISELAPVSPEKLCFSNEVNNSVNYLKYIMF